MRSTFGDDYSNFKIENVTLYTAYEDYIEDGAEGNTITISGEDAKLVYAAFVKDILQGKYIDNMSKGEE